MKFQALEDSEVVIKKNTIYPDHIRLVYLSHNYGKNTFFNR